MDCLDLPAVQETLKSLLQHHSAKTSILWCSAFFIVQLSHPCSMTGKTVALTRWIFVDKVISLLFNMLSRLVVTFLPSCKCLLILLQSEALRGWGPRMTVYHLIELSEQSYHFLQPLKVLHIDPLTFLQENEGNICCESVLSTASTIYNAI